MGGGELHLRREAVDGDNGDKRGEQEVTMFSVFV